MSEIEFPRLLDRDLPKSHINEHYSSQINLLKDMATYGARLISRSYTVSQHNLSDLIILTILLKQFVTFVDSTQILMSEGNVFASKLSLRAMLESELYLNWMLREKTNRVNHFYVGYLRNSLLINQSLTPGTEEHQQLTEILADTSMRNMADKLSIQHEELINQNKLEILGILNLDSFREINAEFLRTRGNRNYEPAWYTIYDGPRSIYALSQQLGMTHEYKIIYSFLSKVTHSQAVEQCLRFFGDHAVIENIRTLNDINFVFTYAFTLVIRVYKTIITEFVPGELQQFNNMYFQEWRQVSMNIPVTISNDNDIIEI